MSDNNSLRGLTDRQREAYQLREAGVSYPKIGAKLGISHQRARQAYLGAKRKLNEKRFLKKVKPRRRAMMKMYVFDYYADKTGFGICDLYGTKTEAIKAAKDYYSRLTAREKAQVTYCNVYEIEATADQIEAINGGENPEPYWTADIWDALKEGNNDD